MATFQEELDRSRAEGRAEGTRSALVRVNRARFGDDALTAELTDRLSRATGEQLEP